MKQLFNKPTMIFDSNVGAFAIEACHLYLLAGHEAQKAKIHE